MGHLLGGDSRAHEGGGFGVLRHAISDTQGSRGSALEDGEREPVAQRKETWPIVEATMGGDKGA
jgi:hypothetical protein